MKETIKLGIVLLLFTAIAGGILAVSNNFTAPIIAERERQESLAAFYDMFKEADDFIDVDESLLEEIKANNQTIREAYEAKKGDETIGHAFKVVSTGFDGDITTVVGVNTDGTISGVKVVSHTETKGIGTRIEGEDFTSSFVGKATESELMPVASPSAENEVLLLSGATVSTKAVLVGVNGAREAFMNYFAN